MVSVIMFICWAILNFEWYIIMLNFIFDDYCMIF